MDESLFHILMVEDQTRHQKLYEAAICDIMPARMTFASDGEEALKKIELNDDIDLILLDLHLPKISGEDVLKKIRQDARMDSVPVIIVTGDPDVGVHERLLEIGADDFIEKGAAPGMFVARLKAQMRHRTTFERLTQLAVDLEMFAAGVLHDIKNLETGIVSVCELMNMQIDEDILANRAALTGNVKSLMSYAEKLSGYATTVIERVRDTSRPLAIEPLQLDGLLLWVADLVNGHAPKDDGTALTWQAAGTLRPVLADKDFLRLALVNLFQNAVKFRRAEAAPHIIVTQENRAEPLGSRNAKRIITRIRDNGIGVKEGELRKIFRPFVRGTSAPKEKKGFGLGLSLVERVVVKMGGRVWAECPADGQGTVFCIELPAV